MTLLERAKQVRIKTRAKAGVWGENRLEELDLAMAVACREVTAEQAREASGIKTASFNNRIANVIFAAIRDGILKVEKVK